MRSFIRIVLIAQLVAFLSVAGPSLSAASVLFEQRPPLDWNGALLISSSIDNLGGRPGIQVADDFRVDHDATIARVDWWGVQRPSSTEAFRFSFYDDLNGAPGELVLSANGLGLEVKPVGTDSLSAYSAALDRGFAATGGARYWLSIFNEGVDSQWLWLTADTTTPERYHATRFLGGQWAIVSDFGMAYRLVGTVPEPSSVALIWVALLACMGARFAVSRSDRKPASVGL